MGEFSMTEGVAFAVFGICVVFIILLIIAGILNIFNIVAIQNAKKTATANEVEQPKTVPASSVQPVVEENLVDDKELVAVLTAAIMAYNAGNANDSVEGTDGLVIKRIRRINSWNKEAIVNNQNSIF